MSFFAEDFNIMKAELNQAFSHSYPTTNERRPKLRSSSLPYCGLKELYHHLKGDYVGFEESYQSLAYTSIGTLVHSLLQNWIPRHAKKVKIIGFWDTTSVKCDNSVCPLKDKIVGLDKKGCPTCGKLPLYEEIPSISDFTSNTDWVWNIKNTRRVYILDIKTTSMKAIYAHRGGRGYYPQYNYVQQLDSYYVQLKPKLEQLGYEIAGTALLYIPRDKPDNYELVPVRRHVDEAFYLNKREFLSKQAKGYVIAGKMRSRVYEIEPEDIDYLNEHKLCTSKSDYIANYDPKSVYHANDRCPLLETCFKRKLLQKTFKKAIKKYEPEEN